MMHDTKVPDQEESSPSSSPQSNPPASIYNHTFFSTEGAAARKALIPGLVLPLFYNSILLWACIALFFGSLVQTNDLSKIRVSAVNLDDGVFGEGIMGGIRDSLTVPGRHLQWNFSDGKTDKVDGDTWSRNLILEEEVWAVLQINGNATLNLQQALTTGDAGYDPLSAMTLYFASARNQVTTLSITIPAIISLLNPLLAHLAATSTTEFLADISTNQTALLTTLHCTKCLASPFSIQQIDLIPFTSTVAFGTLNTGLIFLLTYTFNIFTVLRAAAALHGSTFTLRTQLFIRTLSSLTAYLFLSLMYTLAILAFGIPLNGHYGTTAFGFLALWMLNWCTMGACGLVMEAVFTVVGMRWAPFGLNVWLIANASACFGGFESMVEFYRYGFAMPFYHCIQATRTIFFGTKSHFGLNYGVLVAWMVVGWCGMCLSTAWRVRMGRKTGVHQVP